MYSVAQYNINEVTVKINDDDGSETRTQIVRHSL